MTLAETVFSSLFLTLALVCTASFSFAAARSFKSTAELCGQSSVLIDTDRKIRDVMENEEVTYLESVESTLRRIEDAIVKAALAKGVDMKGIKVIQSENGLCVIASWQYKGGRYDTKVML